MTAFRKQVYNSGLFKQKFNPSVGFDGFQIGSMISFVFFVEKWMIWGYLDVPGS